MEIVELIGSLTVLVILLSITMGAISAIRANVEEQEEHGGTSTNTEEEAIEKEEAIIEEEQTELNEYVEVPAPAPEEVLNQGSSFGVIAPLLSFSLIVAGFFVAKKAKENHKQKVDDAAKKMIEQYKTTTFLEYTGSVSQYLDNIDTLIGHKLSAEDRTAFAKVKLCAKAFDGISDNRGETSARVEGIYIPALKEIAREISKAPSKRIVVDLIPYFHRSCNVLKEAMECELSEYQKKATFQAEARVKAMEQFAALKNDTDDSNITVEEQLAAIKRAEEESMIMNWDW